MKLFKILAAAAVTTVSFGALSMPAQAQVTPLIGQMLPFGGNFCPRGFALANGALLPISQNTALFSILGTTYGGDGRTTFGLPNLQGRSIIGAGRGPGLADYRLGQFGGTEALTIGLQNLPSHTHAGRIKANNGAANSTTPVRNSLAVAPTGVNIYSTADPANNMNANDLNISATGGGQQISKVSPYQVIRWCVALTGTYPSRS